jgi:hypothetical protein
MDISVARLDVRLLNTGKHVEVDRPKAAGDIDALVLVVSELALLELSDQELSFTQVLDRDFLGDNLDIIGNKRRTYIFHILHLDLLLLSSLDQLVKLSQSFVGRGRGGNLGSWLIIFPTLDSFFLLFHLGNHAETLLSCIRLRARLMFPSAVAFLSPSIDAGTPMRYN